MIGGVVPPDYEALSREWSDDEESLVGWQQLRHALGGRVGWWFLDPREYTDYDDGPMWCFGLSGESRLGVTPFGDRFAVYVVDSEDEVVLDAVGELVAWLDEYEHEHEGISPGLSQLLEDPLGRNSENWRDR